jgi:biotin carboxyl carrier protein
MKYVATVDGQSITIDMESPERLLVDGEAHAVDLRQVGKLSLYSLLLDNASYEVVVEDEGNATWRVMIGGELYRVRVEDERTRRLAQANRQPTPPSGEIALKAPIPGLVVKVAVEPGEAVRAGQSLVILEAMKMENELRAPRAGTVHEIRVADGDKVEQGQVLLTLR